MGVLLYNQQNSILSAGHEIYKEQAMNQLFNFLLLFSVIAAACLYKRIGIPKAIMIAFCLPICLFMVAVIILILGGDR